MAKPASETALPRGIWAPTQVFFDEASGELDLPTIERHAVRMAQAGCVGIVTNGSNGESVHLSAEERVHVTRTTRSALDAAGFTDVAVMAGASDQSVRGTLALIADARAAGAIAALLLTPSFFRWAMDARAIEAFFVAVADASPLPVVIYNYPGAVAGLDLDSDLLIRLAQHPNIVGTKFTCGNIGKLARVVLATAAAPSELQLQKSPYMAFSGVADAVVPALSVGGSGAIVGAANVFPRACVRVYDLYVAGRLEEARLEQQKLAQADWALTKRAIPGFKAILNGFHGYGGLPRQPVLPISEEEKEALFQEIQDMLATEQRLPDFGTIRKTGP